MPKLEINNINEIPKMIEEKENAISVNTERRKELEAQLAKLEKSFSKNKISEEEYKSKKTKIKNDMKQAATRITRTKKEIEKYNELIAGKETSKKEQIEPEYSVNYISELLSIMEKKEKDIELNNRRKESINSEIYKLENSYVNNMITMEEYDKKKEELENDIKDVEARLNTLQQSLDAYRKIEELDKKEEKVEEKKEDTKVVEPIQTSYEQYKQRMQLEKDLEYNLKQLESQNNFAQEDRRINVEAVKQAMQTHNEDDIANAIESISNVDSMYTSNMLKPLESMMEAYTNQTYEEYKIRKKALSSLEFNLKQIENQNDFVEDSFKVDIEPIKKALKTRNVDDILNAMDLAEKLTTSNNINARALFADMDKVFFKNDNIIAAPKVDIVDTKVQDDLTQPSVDQVPKDVVVDSILDEPQAVVEPTSVKDSLNYGKREEPVLAKKEAKEEVKENKITSSEVDKIFKTINSKTLADYLFQIPRGNIDKIEEMDPKTEELIEMQEEKFTSLLQELLADKKDELKDPSYVLSSLNAMAPYVNTHALFSEEYYDTRPDEFLINFFKDEGYTAADAYLSENEDRKEIGKRLLDLEKYHYFRSEYDKLPYELEDLNTTKTMALATIKYLKEIDNQIDDSIDQGIYAGVVEKIAEEYGITEEMINTKAKEIEITPIEEDSFDYNNLEEGIIKETEKVLNKEPEAKAPEEKVEAPVEEAKPTFNFNVENDDKAMEYVIPEDSRLNSYTAVKSFKQITRKLYDKISSFNYKEKIKEAISRLRDNNKSIIESEDLKDEKSLIPEQPTVPPVPPRLTEKEAEVVGMEEEIPKATNVPKVSIDDSGLLEAAKILDETSNEALGFEQQPVDKEPEVKPTFNFNVTETPSEEKAPEVKTEANEFIPQTLTAEEIDNLINNPKPNTDVELREKQEQVEKEQPNGLDTTPLTPEEIAVLLGKPVEEEKKEIQEQPKPNFDFNISPEDIVRPKEVIQTQLDVNGWDDLISKNKTNDSKLMEQGFSFNPQPTPQQDSLTQRDIIDYTDWDELSNQVKEEVNSKNDVKIDIDNPYTQQTNYEPLPEQSIEVTQDAALADQLDPHRWEKVNKETAEQQELERQMINDSVSKALEEADKNDPIVR